MDVRIVNLSGGDCPNFRGARGITLENRMTAAKMGLSPSADANNDRSPWTLELWTSVREGTVPIHAREERYLGEPYDRRENGTAPFLRVAAK